MSNYKQNYKFEDLKCFKVIAKCGHTGMNNFILYEFPVRAHNKKEAASKVREMGRVKHHHNDAIREVKQLTLEDYNELKAKCNNDPWIKCESIQDQRRNCPDLVTYREEEVRYKYSDDYSEYRKNKKDFYEKSRRDRNRIEYYERRYKG